MQRSRQNSIDRFIFTDSGTFNTRQKIEERQDYDFQPMMRNSPVRRISGNSVQLSQAHFPLEIEEEIVWPMRLSSPVERPSQIQPFSLPQLIPQSFPSAPTIPQRLQPLTYVSPPGFYARHQRLSSPQATRSNFVRDSALPPRL
jgi:hypothetical protein